MSDEVAVATEESKDPYTCQKICAVPEGTQIYFPLYAALRLRLRAGLN